MKTIAKSSKKLGLDFLVAATRLYACAPKLGIKRVKTINKDREAKTPLDKATIFAYN